MKNQIQCWMVAVWVGRLLYYRPLIQAQPMGLFPFRFSTWNWQLSTRLGSSLSYPSRSSRVANGLFNSKGKQHLDQVSKVSIYFQPREFPYNWEVRAVPLALLHAFLTQDLHSRALPSEISTLSHSLWGPLTQLGLYRKIALWPWAFRSH